MKTPTKFYAYLRSGMERIDSCIALSRLGAARHFAAKKKITLRAWLGIYSVPK